MWKGERFNHGNLPLTAFPAPLADLPIGSGNGCCVVVKQPIPKRFCVDNSWDAVSQVWWKNVRHEPVSSCQWCDLTNNGDMCKWMQMGRYQWVTKNIINQQKRWKMNCPYCYGRGGGEDLRCQRKTFAAAGGSWNGSFCVVKPRVN